MRARKHVVPLQLSAVQRVAGSQSSTDTSSVERGSHVDRGVRLGAPRANALIECVAGGDGRPATERAARLRLLGSNGATATAEIALTRRRAWTRSDPRLLRSGESGHGCRWRRRAVCGGGGLGRRLPFGSRKLTTVYSCTLLFFLGCLLGVLLRSCANVRLDELTRHFLRLDGRPRPLGS